MKERPNIEELEKRVDQLRDEAIELKKMIFQLKRESSIEQHIDSKAELINRNQPIAVDEVPKRVIKETKPIDWEKQIGQIWLPRVFIFVLLLGVIWAFKAASDYGFINEPVKIAIGYVSAALLLFFGHRQIQSNRIALGQVLIGGSVVLLLIVTFSMHVLYEIVPATPAFMLNIVWVGLGIFLAHRHRSEPLAILTGVGGYLIPFLLESENPSVTNFVLFESVLYLALLLFAMWKAFNYLYHVSFALLHITLLAGIVLIPSFDVKVFGVAVIIQHVVLLAAFFLKNAFIKQQMGVLLSSFLLFVLWGYSTFTEIQYELVVLGAFVVYLLISAYFWSKDKVRVSITLTITTLELLIFLVSRFEIGNILGLLIIQGLFSMYVGILASSKSKQAAGFSIYLLSGFITLGAQFDTILSIEFLNWLILIGSFFALLMLLPKFDMLKKIDEEKLRKIIYVGFMALLLMFITLTVTALTESMSLNIQFMSVSLAWAIYALIGIIVGTGRDSKQLRVFGLILLFATLAKLVFVDLAYVSIFIRAILFMGLGLIGVVGSRILYKTQKK